MSIIHDALKKVEKSFQTTATLTTEQRKIKQPNFKIYLGFGLIVALGFFVANLIFSFLAKIPPDKSLAKLDLSSKNQLPASPKPDLSAKIETSKETAALPESAPPQTLDQKTGEIKKEPSPPLVLNGLFFSENEGYALINNRILKEGDEIEGAIVKRITLDAVELEAGGSVIKLSNK